MIQIRSGTFETNSSSSHSLVIRSDAVLKEKWDEMYMGDDGIDGETTSASMFIDLVENQFAKNSCDMNRYPITDNIIDMFNTIRS